MVSFALFSYFLKHFFNVSMGIHLVKRNNQDFRKSFVTWKG